MAQYTAYANYVIFFSDPAEYAAAVAFCGGNGYGHCPLAASVQFGLPWPPVSGPLEGQTKGMYGLEPYGIPVGPPGYNIGHPLPSGHFLQGEVDTVLVPGQLPAPPYTPAGPDMLLIWWGAIVSIIPAGNSSPAPTTPIPQRRWIGGFESVVGLEHGASGGLANYGSRDASRTIDGFGFVIRGTLNPSVWNRSVDQFLPGYTPRDTWERFYVRIKTLGTNACGIWRAHCLSTPIAGGGIQITTLGEILGVSINAASAITVLGTSAALTLNKWYLIDVLIHQSAGGGDHGRMRLYINHNLIFDAADTTGSGLDINTTHRTSDLGQWTVAENAWEVDLDDWIGSDIPNVGGVEHLDSIDWTVGSHVRPVHILSGVLTNYAGQIQTCNQFFNPAITNELLSSSTALALIEALTDQQDLQKYPGQVLGPSGYIMVSAYTLQADSSDGKVGISVLGGAATMQTINEANIAVAGGWLFSTLPLAFLPATLSPISIFKEKSNNVSANSVWALVAHIEYLGAWGVEDNPTALDTSNNTQLLLHNCRFGATQWAHILGGPTAPCFAVGGTYVGNGTTQSINLPAPAHWIQIRALTGGAEIILHQAAGLGAHTGDAERFHANNLIRVWEDSVGQDKFTVHGTDANVNAIGVTYQYIAFCDPGMRFLSCGAYNRNSVPATATIPLFDPAFTPQFAAIQRDVIGSNTTTTQLNVKNSLTHVGNDGQTVAGVSLANWGSFAAGAITVRADNLLSTLRAQFNFALWRTTDPDCGNIAVQVHSYVGNGLALQVINLPLATGRYPLLAWVVPHNSTIGYFRDPSHTLTNSSSLTALGTSATAIMGGGVDQLLVGITLNANLVVYDVFVILGDDDGWNNGTFYESNCIPKGPYVPPTFAPTTEPTIVGDGGIELDGDLTPISMFKTISGIYTLVPGKFNDTFYTGAGAATIDEKIPDPMFKTGYIGG